MANTVQTEWKDSVQSKEEFHKFITNYFRDHKDLSGSYDDGYYFEIYDVRLDSRDGLVVTLTTGSFAGQGFPIKDTENISIEDFRQLLLNKKFADKNMSLTDVFHVAADLINVKL
ncbi:hypothetical protein [Lentilactobacillus kisonensis]|uniref:Uncharacterized protein n=2 Tax=Lentilactobacillus kisonensis TaxID=481722 RepID=H1LH62_9LACO|nr:hypothetical protein [Lentilactobacillus kisonensis]EHO50567.1 hypothetical protein HMPREF9104_01952 [Lentilactobacillus kisonensis F0435]KRL20560.1 hypothetical protein FC98_GL001424 [Lentilactobacillus kisonensis DSM 19906 = JCM 15041]